MHCGSSKFTIKIVHAEDVSLKVFVIRFIFCLKIISIKPLSYFKLFWLSSQYTKILENVRYSAQIIFVIFWAFLMFLFNLNNSGLDFTNYYLNNIRCKIYEHLTRHQQLLCMFCLKPCNKVVFTQVIVISVLKQFYFLFWIAIIYFWDNQGKTIFLANLVKVWAKF